MKSEKEEEKVKISDDDEESSLDRDNQPVVSTTATWQLSWKTKFQWICIIKYKIYIDDRKEKGCITLLEQKNNMKVYME